MSAATDKPTIVIIGAGVIGLTSALCIQRHLAQRTLPHQVVLVAREFPSGLLAEPSVNYASMWAGGHVRPVPADRPQFKQEAGWLKHTSQVLARMAKDEPWLGITPLPGIEYLATPPAGYVDLFSDKKSFHDATGLSSYRLLDQSELPSGMQMGFQYDTFCINTPLYCLSLLRKFLLAGGKTVTKALVHEWEAFELAKSVKLVVNASGMGFGDPACYPIRGQLCLVSNPCSRTITQQNADGTWTFIIPRGFDGGTVIGGTKEPHNWSTEASVETRNRLLQKAKEMYPGILNDRGEFDLIADVVARRPAREGGMRLQVETKQNVDGSCRSVVHAYGAGGRGYEISWGVGEVVVGLVKSVLDEHEVPTSKL